MGCAVATVTVKAAANGDGVLNVFVAGTQAGETAYLTSTLSTYTFDVENPQSGAVELRLENTQKAMYIKSIAIEFTHLDEPEIPQGIVETTDERTNGEWTKVLLNGQLLIRHNGTVYNVLGNKIQ